MSNELREAAKRRRFINANPDHPDAYTGEARRDCIDLADAYLAEHPEDDEEPVTFEWLRSIGAVPHADFDNVLVLEESVKFYLWNDGHPPTVVLGGYGEVDCQARGDVRRLCKYLGIPLKQD